MKTMSFVFKFNIFLKNMIIIITNFPVLDSLNFFSNQTNIRVKKVKMDIFLIIKILCNFENKLYDFGITNTSGLRKQNSL